MCTGGSSTPDNNNYYQGQVRNYAGGWGYSLTDYKDTTKVDIKSFYDDEGRKIDKKNIDKNKKLTDYKKQTNEPSKTTASGVNVDTVNR